MQATEGRSTDSSKSPISIRAPESADGADVWQLVGDIAALDNNSLYCNLLQCSHFAPTCAIAHLDGEVVGWMSGYIPPQQPDALFVWQVCVSPKARNRGLAQGLIEDVLSRGDCAAVRHVRCTITKDNAASWKLFESVARQLKASITSHEHFSSTEHFRGLHDTEFEVVIGPFEQPNTHFSKAA
ncbi:diaminobutyrate acetyltransferase [Rhizobium oryziradicis]|uniref:L-2,4-diaminobutyric acid acetyltransferase n=1 Tax=Rhizobium oryziradicis TaxID=1867956 RepID=A0A1Q8ZVN1_9HYPH|nr:diaminobutyrate acetyltransferase [Rhizobium oryziradicis]OLP45958.1 diaminobutyrate acetyltransferase [Rhizobium oryziradicis]